MPSGGALRDRLAILAPTRTDDAIGGQATTWATVVTVPAMFRDLTGREALQANAMASLMTHRATIRWRSDVTTQSRVRVVATGITYDVLSVRDPRGDSAWLDLELAEAR